MAPMADFADFADCRDPTIQVREEDLRDADVRVRAVLRNLGIGAEDEAEISDEGRDLLRMLAVAYATAGAALASMHSGGLEDLMRAKYDLLTARAKEVVARVDRESLGIAETGSGAAGLGSVTVGRA
jgi:hypothetical protein